MQKENWFVSTIIFLNSRFMFVLTDTGSDTDTMLAESEVCEQMPIHEASNNPVKMEDKNGQTSSTVASGIQQNWHPMKLTLSVHNVPEHG